MPASTAPTPPNPRVRLHRAPPAQVPLSLCAIAPARRLPHVRPPAGPAARGAPPALYGMHDPEAQRSVVLGCEDPAIAARLAGALAQYARSGDGMYPPTIDAFTDALQFVGEPTDASPPLPEDLVIEPVDLATFLAAASDGMYDIGVVESLNPREMVCTVLTPFQTRGTRHAALNARLAAPAASADEMPAPPPPRLRVRRPPAGTHGVLLPLAARARVPFAARAFAALRRRPTPPPPTTPHTPPPPTPLESIPDSSPIPDSPPPTPPPTPDDVLYGLMSALAEAVVAVALRLLAP